MIKPVVPANFKLYKPHVEKEFRFLNNHFLNRTPDYYTNVRNSLNDFRLKVPRKYDGLVCVFINILKQYQLAAGQVPQESLQNKKHKLSDHAFCMALVRMYDVDLMKVKDRVVEDIKRHNVKYAEHSGTITTVLGA